MSMTSNLALKSFILAVAVVMQTLPALADAPRQLYNKTIQLSWSVAVSETVPDGQKKNVTVAVNRIVYVSSVLPIRAAALRSPWAVRQAATSAGASTA